MTTKQFQKWLVEQHTRILEECEDNEDDPCEAWMDFLKSIDSQYSSCSYECHWGDGGVFDYIEALEGLVASGYKRIIVEDPEWEGSSSTSMLFFSPEVLAVAEERQKTK